MNLKESILIMSGLLLMASSGVAQKKSVEVPDYSQYILTPKPAKTPRINGARVFGARPGSQFLF